MAEPIGFPVPPVIKRVRLRLTPDQAFRRFTEGIGGWWPLATLSVSQKADAACFIEGRAGGRVFERDSAGVEHEWGKVDLWSPPAELRLRWHPGRSESEAQSLHLRFEPDGAEATLVTLVHDGWERLGAAAAEARNSYDRGWETAFSRAYAGEHRMGGKDGA